MGGSVQKNKMSTTRDSADNGDEGGAEVRIEEKLRGRGGAALYELIGVS